MNWRSKNNDEELHLKCLFVISQRIRIDLGYILAANNGDLFLVCQALVYLLIQALFLCIMFFVNCQHGPDMFFKHLKDRLWSIRIPNLNVTFIFS